MAATSTTKSAADKLAEQDANSTRTGENKPKPAGQPQAKAVKLKTTLTKAQLTKAAAMRADGATWGQFQDPAQGPVRRAMQDDHAP